MIPRWRTVKVLALLTLLVPFSALGAYVQFEDGNTALMVMYLILGPIVLVAAWVAWRRVLSPSYQETKTLDDTTQASNPGGIRLSHEKMRRFHPELYEPRGLFRVLNRLSPLQQSWRTYHEEHLLHGDSRAAVVVSVSPLLVSAYTDELDCVAVLKFDHRLVEEHGLQSGTRLLTVNLYSFGQTPVADLESGPASYRRYSNFTPYIAEFLSEDTARIAHRKTQISTAEWARAEQLGRAHIAKHGLRVRDGQPLRCSVPTR